MDARGALPGGQTIVFGGALGSKWRKLEVALADRPGTVVVWCGGKPAEILVRCQKLSPCVLIVNQAFIDAIDPEDFSALVDFGQSIRVLVELQQEEFDAVEKLVRMGCMGALSSTTPTRLIRRAVRAVASGEFWVGRRTISRLLNALLLNEKRRLTERESEILSLIGQGLKNQEIAERLFISPQTVRWHVRSLYGKLGIRDRPTAVMHALEIRQGAQFEAGLPLASEQRVFGIPTAS